MHRLVQAFAGHLCDNDFSHELVHFKLTLVTWPKAPVSLFCFFFSNFQIKAIPSKHST